MPTIQEPNDVETSGDGEKVAGVDLCGNAQSQRIIDHHDYHDDDGNGAANRTVSVHQYSGLDKHSIKTKVRVSFPNSAYYYS